MHTGEPANLHCDNRHSFDLAKQGYINLLATSVKASKYDTQLFLARQKLNECGFFRQLLTAMSECIKANTHLDGQEQLVILDAGCGEGSHLAGLVTSLSTAGQRMVGIGIDIARDGIRLAASSHDHMLWCVANLARTPLQDGTCDLILNILSPANYSEFQRLLRPKGIVIKVLPGPDYLQELRAALYTGSGKETYQNKESVQQFKHHFKLLHTKAVYYQQPLTAADLENLLRMTPLAWNADADALQAIGKKGLKQITVDATILVGASE